jgi:signal transduction histidine kinase
LARPAGLKALIAQRNVLIALTRYLMQDRTGGVLGAAIEMLVQVLRARGALAYLLEGEELVLVAHHGLPRRAKAWLTHLPMNAEPWFVAQRVVHERKKEVDTDLAASRAGMGIRPVLEEAGWKALAAVPLQVSRDVLGVVVLATVSEGAFDRETMNMLEAVGGILALSLERENTLAQGREEKARAAETAQLATMGLVASNVARELAAPVGALTMQLDEYQQDLRDLRRALDQEGNDPVHVSALKLLEDRAGDIYDTVHKMQGLTSRLLSFSRETSPEPVDLGRVIDRVAATVQSNLDAKNIVLSIEGNDDEVVVEGREESLQMLVLQLVLYAMQECEGTGTAPEIVVTLANDTVEERAIVTVAASGRGSAQQSGARIYDAMVKGGRNATVGLELAKQTAQMHGGRVETGISALGGVQLTVTLPTTAAMVAHPASTPIPGGEAGVEHVLEAALEAAPTSGSMGLDLDLQFPPGTSPSRPPPTPEPFESGGAPGLELDIPGLAPPPAMEQGDFGVLDEPGDGTDDSFGNALQADAFGDDESANDESENDESENDESENDESENDESENDESAYDDSFDSESFGRESFEVPAAKPRRKRSGPPVPLPKRRGLAGAASTLAGIGADSADDFVAAEAALEALDTPAPNPDDFLFEPAAPAPEATHPGTTGGPTVLWIDGDVEAAEAIGQQLTGYDVQVVGSVEAANRAIAALSSTPEMVLCSVALPDGSGPDLHADADFTLASRFVFIVGGVVTGDQAAYVQRSGCPTLIKPLTADEVSAILGVDPDDADSDAPAPLESIPAMTDDVDVEW